MLKYKGFFYLINTNVMPLFKNPKSELVIDGAI